MRETQVGQETVPTYFVPNGGVFKLTNLAVSEILNEVTKSNWTSEPPKFYKDFFKPKRLSIFRSGMDLEAFNKFITENKCVFFNHNFRTFTYNKFASKFSLAVIDVVTYSYRFKETDCDYLIFFVPQSYLSKTKTSGLISKSFKLCDNETFMVALELSDFMVREQGASLVPEFFENFCVEGLPKYYLEFRGHKAPKKEIGLMTGDEKNYFYHLPQTLLVGKSLQFALTNITGQAMVAIKEYPNFRFNKILVVISSKGLSDLDNSRFYPLYDINKGRQVVIGLDYHDVIYQG